MRERRMLYGATPCDTNFYPDGPKTLAEANTLGKQMCPHWERCTTPGFFMKNGGKHACVMKTAIEIAKYSTEGSSVAAEMVEFREDTPRPGDGWVWSADRKEFSVVKDHEEAFKRIEEFAHTILGDK